MGVHTPSAYTHGNARTHTHTHAHTRTHTHIQKTHTSSHTHSPPTAKQRRQHRPPRGRPAAGTRPHPLQGAHGQATTRGAVHRQGLGGGVPACRGPGPRLGWRRLAAGAGGSEVRGERSGVGGAGRTHRWQHNEPGPSGGQGEGGEGGQRCTAAGTQRVEGTEGALYIATAKGWGHRDGRWGKGGGAHTQVQVM